MERKTEPQRYRAPLHGVGLTAVRRGARLETEVEARKPIGEPCSAAKKDAAEGLMEQLAYVRGDDGDCQIAALRSHEDAAVEHCVYRMRNGRDAWKLGGRMREGSENENKLPIHAEGGGNVPRSHTL